MAGPEEYSLYQQLCAKYKLEPYVTQQLTSQWPDEWPHEAGMKEMATAETIAVIAAESRTYVRQTLQSSDYDPNRMTADDWHTLYTHIFRDLYSQPYRHRWAPAITARRSPELRQMIGDYGRDLRFYLEAFAVFDGQQDRKPELRLLIARRRRHLTRIERRYGLKERQLIDAYTHRDLADLCGPYRPACPHILSMDYRAIDGHDRDLFVYLVNSYVSGLEDRQRSVVSFYHWMIINRWIQCVYQLARVMFADIDGQSGRQLPVSPADTDAMVTADYDQEWSQTKAPVVSVPKIGATHSEDEDDVVEQYMVDITDNGETRGDKSPCADQLQPECQHDCPTLTIVATHAPPLLADCDELPPLLTDWEQLPPSGARQWAQLGRRRAQPSAFVSDASFDAILELTYDEMLTKRRLQEFAVQLLEADRPEPPVPGLHDMRCDERADSWHRRLVLRTLYDLHRNLYMFITNEHGSFYHSGHFVGGPPLDCVRYQCQRFYHMLNALRVYHDNQNNLL